MQRWEGKMARPATPLTEEAIRKAKPREKAYRMYDGGGLHLFISPSGGKYWRVKFRKLDGKEAVRSVGSYPELSLKNARAQARMQTAIVKSSRRRRKMVEECSLPSDRARQNILINSHLLLSDSRKFQLSNFDKMMIESLAAAAAGDFIQSERYFLTWFRDKRFKLSKNKPEGRRKQLQNLQSIQEFALCEFAEMERSPSPPPLVKIAESVQERLFSMFTNRDRLKSAPGLPDTAEAWREAILRWRKEPPEWYITQSINQNLAFLEKIETDPA
jgi:hypothetical protein